MYITSQSCVAASFYITNYIFKEPMNVTKRASSLCLDQDQ